MYQNYISCSDHDLSTIHYSMFHILQTIHVTYCQTPCFLCVMYKGHVYGISMHDFVPTPSLSFSMMEMPEIQISSNKCCKCSTIKLILIYLN